MMASTDARLLDHPEIVEAYHLARRLPGYGSGAAAIFRSSLQIGGRARRRWVLTEAELARITQPVLFVWGESSSTDGCARFAGCLDRASWSRGARRLRGNV